MVEVRTEAQGRAAVAEAVAHGADFVKVYSHLFPGPYAAIAGEAKRLGIPFAGHVPMQVPVQDALTSGQLTMEHLYNLVLSTSSKRQELFDRMRTVFASAEDALLWFRTWSALEQEAVATHDPAEARRLYRALARSGSWQCPTLEVHWVFAYPEEVLADSRRQDLLRRYVQPSMRQQWLASMRAQVGRPPEEAARAKEAYAAKVRMVGELSRAGVGLLGGTDSWIPFRFPGFSLHDELALFVAAGVSPMRALQSVTRDAARCLGWGDRSGTVTPGKLADLVVLDGNPLADIGQLRRVHSVISRGVSLSPTRLLADAEAAAQQDPAGYHAAPRSAC